VLRRFVAYLDKVFDFNEGVKPLRDTRIGAQIPTAGLWLSLFWMFVLRIKSFNALEQELRLPGRWTKLAGRRRPSADALGYGLCRFAVEPVRALLEQHQKRAWRNKAIQGRRGQKRRVVALDGHELYSSTARCCPGCLIRDVEVKPAQGIQKVRQYYHRVVVAQWVGVTPPGILDVEPIRPGEGEVVAAGRLWERIAQSYGRLIDVVTLDAIYLEAPFLKKVRHAGKHFVVVMKQEKRQLYQDADQLRAAQPPQVLEESGKRTRVWDLPELTTFETYAEPVRVVWAEERTEKSKRIGGQRQTVTEEKTWVWVTDLSATVASVGWIQRWGHDRWNLENRGFNELVNLWGMDHCFVHLPRAIEVILLTLALAFLVTYLFFERNLKLEIRTSLSRLVLAQRMREDLAAGELAPSG
jgi:DDE family transposase